MSEVNQELDRLLDTLEAPVAVAVTANAAVARGPDAIDRVLASAPRVTAARSLREDEVVRRFHAEVESGLLRVDTVRQLLGLIRLAMEVPPA